MTPMNAASEILHPVVICQVMINFAASHGVDAETCLMGTGIHPDNLLDADALISREQEIRLVENLTLELPNMPGLGFHLGSRYNVSTFGIWGFVLRTSRNLRDAIRHGLRFLPLSTAYCRIGMMETDDTLGIVLDPTGVPQHLRQFFLERDLATAINILRELSLTGLSLPRLQLQGPKLDYADEITALSGLTPTFGCKQNALTIPRAEAEKPLPTFDPNLVRMLEDQCRQQLERRQKGGVTGQVRSQLLGPVGLAASVEDITQALGVSPRGLRRKLEAEGTSFRQIVDEERRQLAEQLLGGTQMTLDEMAILLGYADTASFNRAFRRWHHLSPGEYRKRQCC